jgi:uridine phosphorylase
VIDAVARIAGRATLQVRIGFFVSGCRLLVSVTSAGQITPVGEAEAAIEAARAHGALAVEMEAAALYVFARARGRNVLCFAHVTNQMARIEGDFEKGEAGGTHDALDVIATAARACGFG